MSGSYPEFLQNAAASVPGTGGFLASEGFSFLDFLRSLAGNSAQTPAVTPAAAIPGVLPSNAPISPSVISTSALPPPGPSAPSASAASAPPAQAAPSNAFLDMLRQRVKDQIANESRTRLSDIGAGMLASGSPNFFTMLGQGLQNSQQAQRQRQEELRRIVEQESAAADRAARLEEERQRRLQEAPLTAARIDQIRDEIRRGVAPNWVAAGEERSSGDVVYVNTRDPNQRVTMPGVQPPRTTRFTTQAENALRERAMVQARTAADNERRDRAQTSRPMDQTEWNTRYRELLRGNLAQFGLTELPGTETPAPGGTGQQSGQSNPPVMRERFVPPNERR